MKLAICLSGQPRDIKNTLKKLNLEYLHFITIQLQEQNIQLAVDL